MLYKEIKKEKNIFYASLLQGINSLPLIIQIHQVRVELEKKFDSSIPYVRMALSMTWFIVIMLMLLLFRLVIGIEHNKNIGFLIASSIACVFSAFVFMIYVRKYFWQKLFPREFEKQFIPENIAGTDYSSWQWKYFLGGTVIASGLLPMIGYTSRHNGGNCGSSCGSGCSSSCGSGGCGGGGGCGGCGGGD